MVLLDMITTGHYLHCLTLGLRPLILFSFPDGSKSNIPEDFDIDMEDPETKKAAVTIQSQFRKFQKKKRDEKS